MDIIDLLREYDVAYKKSEKSLSRFRSGGPMSIVGYLRNEYQTISFIKRIQKEKIEYRVIGNGSNILIPDEGIKCLVLSTKYLNSFNITKEKIYALSGVSLSFLANLCKEYSVSGLEELCSIPASIGGAIFNNCGAFGKEISDVVEFVDIIENGEIKRMSKDLLSWGYRESIFKKTRPFILAIGLKLEKEDKKVIQEKMQQVIQKRLVSQPTGISLGSVFKKPRKELSAGYLIEQVGLKGKRIGGAIISEKHANFILNIDNAKSKDFIELASLAAYQVDKRYSIRLQYEIEILS